MLELLEGYFDFGTRFGPEERVTLRFEVPFLNTGSYYDALHCYVSLGGSSSKWYPDC